jgi:hypothetical protein
VHGCPVTMVYTAHTSLASGPLVVSADRRNLREGEGRSTSSTTQFRHRDPAGDAYAPGVRPRYG